MTTLDLHPHLAQYVPYKDLDNHVNLSSPNNNTLATRSLVGHVNKFAVVSLMNLFHTSTTSRVFSVTHSVAVSLTNLFQSSIAALLVSMLNELL
jgi:hypothetical protein